MKLKEVIDSKGGIPGSTPEGRAWALKALHPADPVVEVRGIPDEDSVPTVFQNYQFTFSVPNPTPATVGTWDCDVFMHPNPVVPCSIRTFDSAGNYLWSPIANDQIGVAGSTWNARKTIFCGQVERYRLAYQSLTGHLDAAAVTNQGMVAAAQYPVIPQIAGYQLQSVGAPGSVLALCECYSELPKTWAQLQTMPNAYLGTAKEGVYSPYKLTETCQDWVSARDQKCFFPYGTAATMFNADGMARAAAAAATNTVSGAFPYGLGGAYQGAPDGTAVIMTPRADTGMLHIAFRGLHYQSTLTFMFRAGYELQVSPGSPLTSFAKVSPPYDPVASTGYFAISREMKDGYPEEYNNLAMLIPVVQEIASRVLPKVVPWLGKMAGKLFGAAPSRRLEATAETGSAAAKERARAEYTAAAATPVPRAIRAKPKRKRNQRAKK
jgi:hypothetical protein